MTKFKYEILHNKVAEQIEEVTALKIAALNNYDAAVRKKLASSAETYLRDYGLRCATEDALTRFSAALVAADVEARR